ncbi:hypothetical protein [Rhodococcus jostii]|nr:hypothetical protein [Rhodococcus jostii]
MGEWILRGLNVAALGVLLGWMVRNHWERRSRGKLSEQGLDHLADGRPYVTFGFHQGPIEVHTQDGDVIATLPLEPGTVRITEATRVLTEHGWQQAGALIMSGVDTIFVPVTHRPVPKSSRPHAQGEL